MVFAALIRNTCMFFTICEKLEVLSELVNPITVTLSPQDGESQGFQ